MILHQGHLLMRSKVRNSRRDTSVNEISLRRIVASSQLQCLVDLSGVLRDSAADVRCPSDRSID